MTDAKRLYQAVIVEHSKNPRHAGPLEDETHHARCTNPLCGDRVTVHLRVEEARIAAATFEAKGCAIAKASASLLTEAVIGRGTSEATALGGALEAALRGGEADLGSLEPLRGVAAFPSRIRCATLPWEALTKALESAG